MTDSELQVRGFGDVGVMLPGGKQVIKSDLDYGHQTVSNAIALQKAVGQ